MKILPPSDQAFPPAAPRTEIVLMSHCLKVTSKSNASCSLKVEYVNVEPEVFKAPQSVFYSFLKGLVGLFGLKLKGAQKMLNKHPWYSGALRQIDVSVSIGKNLLPWEDAALKLIRKRVELDLGLSDEQEDDLRRIHARLNNASAVRR